MPARVLLSSYALIGPTASGKEGAALVLAGSHGLEILSLDSMKLFRGMDVGTAKATAAMRRRVPHHLLDLAEPSEQFNARDWLSAADAALIDIASRGARPLFSGGTALYLQTLLHGLFVGPAAQPELRRRLKAVPRQELHDRLTRVDPHSAATIHVNDLRRLVRALEIYEITGTPPSALRKQWQENAPRRSLLIAGIRRNRRDLFARINVRVDRMLEAGLVDEVERLLASPHGLGQVARQALGYKEIADFLTGALGSLDEAVDLIKQRTRHLARRQITWFKRFDVAWVDAAEDEGGDSIARRAATALSLCDR